MIEIPHKLGLVSTVHHPFTLNFFVDPWPGLYQTPLIWFISLALRLLYVCTAQHNTVQYEGTLSTDWSLERPLLWPSEYVSHVD